MFISYLFGKGRLCLCAPAGDSLPRSLEESLRDAEGWWLGLTCAVLKEKMGLKTRERWCWRAVPVAIIFVTWKSAARVWPSQ